MHLGAIERHLVVDVALTTEPVREGTHWNVVSVYPETDYWRVEMAFVDGVDYCSETLLFRMGAEGDVQPLRPSDVGITVTTSVS